MVTLLNRRGMDNNGEDGDAHLVSVASCDPDSVTSVSPAPLPSSLLFSLQFYVDSVALNPVTPSPSLPNSLLLAFQLLQYEIVMFDDALACTETSTTSEAAVTKLRHGKSCLFEADPHELLHELQQNVEMPLTLLLLAIEHGRARLRAFANVPLSLHVGLQDDVVSCSRLLRICEWASQSGSWKLRDHHNTVVGSVTGVVTLSCLGKALAPHLKQALGVQVNKSQPSSPCVEADEVKELVERPPTPVDADVEECDEKNLASDAKQETKEVEKIDSGVQCDEDSLVEDAIASLDSLSLPRNTSSMDIGKGGLVKTTTHNYIADGHVVYYRSTSRKSVTSSPRRITQRQNRESPRVDRVAAIKDNLLLPRELPPPLFFQKRAKS